MTRIPLTDEDISIIAHGEPTNWRVSMFVHDNTRDSAEQLKKQILDDYEFREKDLICPQYRLSVTQYKELKEKAEKWDSWNISYDYAKVKEMERELEKNKEIVQKLRENIHILEPSILVDKILGVES